MDYLSYSVRAEITEKMRVELDSVFNDIAEENEKQLQCMKATVQSLLKDIEELEAVMRAEEEEWEGKKVTLLSAIEAARMEEEEEFLKYKGAKFYTIKWETEQRDEVKEKNRNLELHNKELQERLAKQDDEEEEEEDAQAERAKEQTNADAKNQEKWTSERVDHTLSTALAVAALKRQVLAELKMQAAKEFKVPSPQEVCDAEASPSMMEEKFEVEMKELHVKLEQQKERLRAAQLQETERQEEKTRKQLEKLWAKEMKLAKEKAKREEKARAKEDKLREKEEEKARKARAKEDKLREKEEEKARKARAKEERKAEQQVIERRRRRFRFCGIVL